MKSSGYMIFRTLLSSISVIRSYHDEEHYNSVRLKEDTGDGPARPITIKADSNLSASSRQAKAGSNKSKSGAGKDITDAGSIKLVMAGSGCENIEKVEQTLLQMYGDVDAAIEYLIAEKGIEDFSEETVQSPCNADASHGDDANGNSEEQREEPVEETYKDNPPSNSAKRTHDDGSAQREDKKIPRNKACACGSKKKYKSCCGSGTGKVSAISNDQALESRKSRKEKNEAREGLTHLHFLLDLMEGHLTWGLFVSNLLLKCGLSSPQESRHSCGYIIASMKEWVENQIVSRELMLKEVCNSSFSSEQFMRLLIIFSRLALNVNLFILY
ncbi:hypothetical protein BT93_L2655 [Corymbia citriodora subsp. variegata]|uniref:Uncharacterized protein n=1 Tax=Corymbia citriodora subsp. variegata TaxID=360336 RepID=A0A8T0CZY7_CORYI|nr:hypothetical protein BT93_L2655 [Corymbia citriodora subsp. variegata]